MVLPRAAKDFTRTTNSSPPRQTVGLRFKHDACLCSSNYECWDHVVHSKHRVGDHSTFRYSHVLASAGRANNPFHQGACLVTEESDQRVAESNFRVRHGQLFAAPLQVGHHAGYRLRCRHLLLEGRDVLEESLLCQLVSTCVLDWGGLT